MRLPLAAGQRSAYGEDAEAAARALFGLTVGVGGFAAAIALAGNHLPFTALPTLALLACLLAGSPIPLAAYAAGVVWLVLLPAAPGEALLVPLTMMLVCLAIALGPDRLLAWAARDVAPPPPGDDAGQGWIEEERLRVG